jgi:hypothetical protein
VAKIIEHPATRGGVTPPARLTAAHILTRFDCGNVALNDWLKSHALTSEGQTARTYVTCDSNIVIGYYCISTGSIERRALPSKMRRQQGLPNQIPVAIIGRLARDSSYKGAKLGQDLLRDAFERIVSASEIIGVRCVLVHAIDDDAAKFWKKHEFVEYPDSSRSFYMPVETIISAL